MRAINRSPRQTRVELWLLILVLLLCWGSSAQAQTAAPGDEQALTPARIKAEFDAAMGRPLAERIPELEELEQRISSDVLQGKLSGKQKTEALYYKYHVEMQSAKLPEAYGTYCAYLNSFREHATMRQAAATFLRDLNEWSTKKDYVHLNEVCGKVVEQVGDDQAVVAVALYHQGLANYRLNGKLSRCVELCEALIAQHPDSPWRSEAMRMMANAQFGQGKYKEAIASLQLLKQQYPGTKLEQYADMRPAAIWELRGEPQKALEVYQGTLQHYPDHMYGPYVHRQIARLQRVIEEQLIRDALEGLGKKDAEPEEQVGPAGAAAAEPQQPQTTPAPVALDDSSADAVAAR